MYILNINCKDKPGIVAAVANCLNDNNCNIEESAQYNDPLSGHFFMRVVFSCLKKNAQEQFRSCFEQTALRYEMQWEIYNKSDKVKALILVSKAEHCLNDLLYRWRTDHLNIDIAAVASNHPDLETLVTQNGLPFHHCPITKESR
jgi:formyltetrahydrofolate deformylase